MRRTEKNRAIKRKQKQAAMAVKLNCGHFKRTHLDGDPSGLLTCLDCGEPIRMLAHGIFGQSMDPKAKRNSVNTKHG